MPLSSSISQEAMPPGTALLVTDASAIILVPTPTNDPNDPLNCSLLRKSVNIGLVYALTVAIFTAIVVQAVFWPQMTVELGMSFAELNAGLACNVAGLAIGCILFIPFTMKYGRRPTYIISATVMAAVSWWSARIQTLADMYITNFIYGLASSTNETIAQLTIADLFFIHDRGKANSLYVIASILGNTLSPTLAGLQAQAQGWRWSYYTMAIVLSFLVVIFIFFFEETSYTPVSLGQSAPASSTGAKAEEFPKTAKTVGSKQDSNVGPAGDGCTAALTRPYGGSDLLVHPIWPREAMTKVVHEAAAARMQCAIHAIGDRAATQAIDCIEAAATATNSFQGRHRIEHLEVVSAADAKRLGQLGITASVQPIHSDPARLVDYAQLVGAEAFARAFPYREFLDGGARVAIGSDAPTASHDIFKNLYSATTRRSVSDRAFEGRVNPSGALTLAQAMAAATAGTAYSRFAEGWVGSLQAGMQADLLVLDAAWEPERLLEATVWQTWSRGEKVYQA